MKGIGVITGIALLAVLISLAGAATPSCPVLTGEIKPYTPTITKITDETQFLNIVAENLKWLGSCGNRDNYALRANNYIRMWMNQNGYTKKDPKSTPAVTQVWVNNATKKTLNVIYVTPMQNSGGGRKYHPWYFHFASYPRVDNHLVLGWFRAQTDSGPLFQAIVLGGPGDLQVDPMKPETWPK
jgi:hypothetical protein